MPDIFSAKTKTSKTNIPRSSQVWSKGEEQKKDNLSEQKILSAKPDFDKNPLSSLRLYPEKTEFINKDPEEKVILLLRRHPITNTGWIIVSFIMIIAPSFLTVLPFFESLTSGMKIIAVLIWYLLSLTYIFEKFLNWFFNVNIVTDERVFDIDFISLVYYKITDANIDQIQDVTVEAGGTVRTLFNYGNVLIQTAAEIPQIEFESVPDPEKVARVLRELRVEEEVEKLEGRIR
ncbi:hypothetical protein A2Z22_02795 [Candidatus Woesebacteria bacterium RBG_16_34_12]|uniref:Uncharacterized protein n=1 Tax=Candidatus Woesebacteria bacterium RBG_16_34_12 TaxID=1802480 RepID=A0A1F7X7S5_9BACT|nr:MAG: hypothetical protein A2Z22_02795 [Candidatus Woesebacteria bacterium RBG_16_34_12]